MSLDPLEYVLNRMEAERGKPPPTVGYPSARKELLDGIVVLRAERNALHEAYTIQLKLKETAEREAVRWEKAARDLMAACGITDKDAREELERREKA